MVWCCYHLQSIKNQYHLCLELSLQVNKPDEDVPFTTKVINVYLPLKLFRRQAEPDKHRLRPLDEQRHLVAITSPDKFFKAS